MSTVVQAQGHGYHCKNIAVS